MYKLATLCGALALCLMLLLPAHTYAQRWGAEDPNAVSSDEERSREQEGNQPAAATVTNGDFETGTLSGWTVFTTGNGSWLNYTGSTTTSQSSFSSVQAPPQGTRAAYADMSAPGSQVLYQDIALPAGQRHTLSFILYYTNRYTLNTDNGFVDPAPTATNLSNTQHYRVDLIKTTATPDTMVASDILMNIFRTRVGDPEALQPTLITADISAFAGQTVRLRFAAGVYLYWFFTGVDDVRITSDLVLTGRITNAAGRAVPHTAVTLSGASSATVLTDAVGRYTFNNVTSGGNYTVTPAKNGYTFTPASQSYTNLTASQTTDFAATGGLNAPTAGQVLINRFRTRGPLGTTDEFIELYNNTDMDIVVNDPTPPTSGVAGWALVGGDAPTTARVVVPNGVLIPARGHYLVAQTFDIGVGYNLTTYAGADTGHTANFADGRGIALFRTSNTANFNLANRLDAVGFAGETNALFFDGTPIPITGGVTTNLQHVFMRKLTTGQPQTSNNNATDFVFVDTTGAAVGGVQSVLGGPNPQNFSIVVERRGVGVSTGLINPAQPANASPNHVRDTRSFTYTRTSSTGGTISFPNGTLSIQRRVINTTDVPVKRLRFRVVDMTSGPAAAGTADLRVLSSTGVVTDSTGATVTTVNGLRLEEPPNQDAGGGLNSTVRAGTIDLRTPLAPGASIDVQFLLGVQTGGSFRFFIIVEPLN